MKEYLTEWIRLKEDFNLQDGDKSSVLALYQFADRLSEIEEIEAKKILVDLYQKLGMMESAFRVFSNIFDKADRKQLKKFATLQELSNNRGDDFALPRPLTVVEEAERQECLKDLPYFRYHPDPLATDAFVEGEEQICPCCGKKSRVYYAMRPYCIDDVDYLCPMCIANGEAAKKFDAEFVQGAEWTGEPDEEKNNILFYQTPGYLSWRCRRLSCKRWFRLWLSIQMS